MTNVEQVLEDVLAQVDVIPSRYVMNMRQALGLPALRTYALKTFMDDRRMYRVLRPASSVQTLPPAIIWHVRGVGPCTMFAREMPGEPMSWDRGKLGFWRVDAQQRAVLCWLEARAVGMVDGRATRWADKPGRNVEQTRIASEIRYHARQANGGSALIFRPLGYEEPKVKRVCIVCQSSDLHPPYPRCAPCQTTYRLAHRGIRAVQHADQNEQHDDRARSLARGSAIRAERKRLMRESAEYAADLARRRAAGEVMPDPETLKPEWVE